MLKTGINSDPSQLSQPTLAKIPHLSSVSTTISSKVAFFDIDDTLLKTENIALGVSYQVIKDAIKSKSNDVDLTSFTLENFLVNGTDKRFCDNLPEIASRFGVYFNQNEIDNWAVKEVEAVIKELGKNCQESPGATPLLNHLQECGIPSVAVSSSATKRLVACFEATNLRDHFPDSEIISGANSPICDNNFLQYLEKYEIGTDGVTLGQPLRAKPNPDTYLWACCPKKHPTRRMHCI
jgi:phosphoglycolate phosphatase-like HAD superfamily hydrolase